MALHHQLQGEENSPLCPRYWQFPVFYGSHRQTPELPLPAGGNGHTPDRCPAITNKHSVSTGCTEMNHYSHTDQYNRHTALAVQR